MKIAILGTRGIPNYHGGFEQFAEFLSEFLVKKGHEVFVYNSSNHPYQESTWRGVNIVHKFDPEDKIGTAGQFIYDFNCIIDSRKRKFDVILQLGYTSSSVWYVLLPKSSKIITNMDGLEWKRAKYNKYVQRFLKYAEKLAVKSSDYLISDSEGIKLYLKEKHNVDSEFIAYGATVFEAPDVGVLDKYGLKKFNYNLLIARLEPENNIETILEGVEKSSGTLPFLVIGKHNTKYGQYLKNRFKKNNEILFLGGIYNQEDLNNLRYFSNLYFHGHSVGGTNPSLLEAMASNALIVANDNIFNKSILQNDALYFKSSVDVNVALSKNKEDFELFLSNNKIKIEKVYDWNLINHQYETFIKRALLSV
ncbi:MAG: glycosyl transferase family 1 [Flavobacteriaceae bacterium]|nr:glycosyl transferase family 1 [Flavobacteriaceae bacterium]MBD09350.1 glycosyl transferase family 1 [Flavobacteriaceae bacterium]|tara:strand:- start:6188 stop:7279 length:1092 start_codon:yes stop_codon:yes gene_type:complete